jgi:hypothetical protein
MGEFRPATDDAIAASIRDWSEKLKEVEAIRAREMPVRETAAALGDLQHLRSYAMGFAERLDRQARGLLTVAEQENAERGDLSLKFVRTARSVRQIVVLEQETMGLRPIPEARAAARPSPSHREAVGPSPGSSPGQALSRDAEERHDNERREPSDLKDRERSDLDDLYDYDDGPLEQVLAGVRKALKVPAGFAPECSAGAATGGRPCGSPEVAFGDRALNRLTPRSTASSIPPRRGEKASVMVRERKPP